MAHLPGWYGKAYCSSSPRVGAEEVPAASSPRRCCMMVLDPASAKEGLSEGTDVETLPFGGFLCPQHSHAGQVTCFATWWPSECSAEGMEVEHRDALARFAQLAVEAGVAFAAALHAFGALSLRCGAAGCSTGTAVVLCGGGLRRASGHLGM